MVKNKAENRAAGRPKKEIDHFRFRELYAAWEIGKISQKNMCVELDISRATLARLIAAYRSEIDDEPKLQSEIFVDPALFKIDEHNVSDGLEFLKNIKTSKISAVFFDPQYRHILDYLQYGNEGHGRQKGRSSLPQMTDAQISAMINEISRSLKPSGYLFLWIDKYLLTDGTTLDGWISRSKLLRKVDLIVWDKQRLGMGSRSRYRTEYLLIVQKEPLSSRQTWFDHGLPDVWSEKIKDRKHPHQKPIGLLKRLIVATTVPGDVICDPAAGSYITLSATLSVGDRHFVGCDIQDQSGK